MKISKAKLIHIKDILEIEKESKISPWSESSYIEEIKRIDSIFLTATYRSETLGFIIARMTTSGEAEIYNIAVKKKARNLGAGTALFNAAVNLSIKKGNVNVIWLEVRESNLSAINFYKKHNFKIVGVRKNFYSNPMENALLMKLDSFELRNLL